MIQNGLRSLWLWVSRHRKKLGTLSATMLALSLMLGSTAAISTGSSSQPKADKPKHSQTHKPVRTPAPTQPPVEEAAPAPAPAPEAAPEAAPPAEAAPAPAPAAGGSGESAYPLHTRIPATTFWVGEIFDPNAEEEGEEL